MCLPDTIIEVIRDKKIGCIYKLYDEEIIVYVGQSKVYPPHNRIYTHLKDKKFTHYSFELLDTKMLNDREADLICELQPKYNSRLPICSKYISMTEILQIIRKPYSTKSMKTFLTEQKVTPAFKTSFIRKDVLKVINTKYNV